MFPSFVTYPQTFGSSRWNSSSWNQDSISSSSICVKHYARLLRSLFSIAPDIAPSLYLIYETCLQLEIGFKTLRPELRKTESSQSKIQQSLWISISGPVVSARDESRPLFSHPEPICRQDPIACDLRTQTKPLAQNQLVKITGRSRDAA